MLNRLRLSGLTLVLIGCAVGCQKSDPETPVIPPAVAGSGGSGGGGSAAAMAGEGGAAAGDEPGVRKGERGSSCDSTNDCADDLSCVVTHDCPVGVNCANKSCQPSNFGLMGSGKSCFISECSSKADCCGDMPETLPAKCAKRNSICNTPYVPGCTTKVCTGNQECGEGTCAASTCYYGATACMTTADCPVNSCDAVSQTCAVSTLACSATACLTNTCLTRYCNCTNPEYAPTSAICSDPDCEGVCGFNCEEDRCVVDTRCGSDLECGATTPHCDDGKCVECLTDADCEKEECIDGHCGPECKTDTQCKVFEACQAEECVYVGCRSDRECVLQAGTAAPTQDPRLAKCRIEDEIGTCVFPCDIDAQCAPSEVCLDGVCEYIGCETDSECKTIVGLHNLPSPTPERPWVTTVECRAESSAKP